LGVVRYPLTMRFISLSCSQLIPFHMQACTWITDASMASHARVIGDLAPACGKGPLRHRADLDGSSVPQVLSYFVNRESPTLRFAGARPAPARAPPPPIPNSRRPPSHVQQDCCPTSITSKLGVGGARTPSELFGQLHGRLWQGDGRHCGSCHDRGRASETLASFPFLLLGLPVTGLPT
jgi:hypothetical protein